MKFTNHYNLDQWICDFLAEDNYDFQPGTISATTLIGPARAWALKQLHPDDLVADYSDFIKTKNGDSIHAGIERSKVAEKLGGFQERRFYAELNGFHISGKMDMVLDNEIHDFKSTGTWKYVKKDFDDYFKQLSIYRWLLAKNGIQVSDYGNIHMFLNDWKRADSLRNSDYPPIPYVKLRIRLMSVDEAEEYIASRVMEFAFALGSLPECTPKELWQTETTWAIYRKAGQSRAFRVLNTEEDANRLAAEIGGVVVKRPGAVKRCGYCSARFVCEQYNHLKEAGLVDGD